ncbi:Glycosyltransferase involved in cell wall bisynthesis [Roseovarius nanhaiticus]|uniref:Glycosyltransferase involved in cell wall bisynthesis n=1 Tax=Roseovarius nanhaiticus TaxID=573024 RepID=A0A1N7H2I0_9RHOB|nr:glycosyltransferase [Roseovarius nanhaiticus]SEL15401.1 Glycosyltransferase involved in cell wall bisynthesis [Roseovarius nanhaiticus]SIS19052.1 Glycosyltransferase involved in cell wall bisynthesis [Roseovarius nanhaiticus]
MKILFIHQNFPGQFKHLAPALAAAGHECTALTLKVKEQSTWRGVRVIPYALPERRAQQVHPWLIDLDTKVTRGEACWRAARALADEGYAPDLILAHHGWGESMFLRDLWPGARMALYCELYHQAGYPHLDFDPEFASEEPEVQPLRIRLKNLGNHLHFPVAEAGLSPTEFQADTFPPEFRNRITVCHDGIDTSWSAPKPDVKVTLKGHAPFTRDTEVITFINRNLEPYRGYHVFMRALPDLLRARPDARVIIIGGDETSYGSAPPKGRTWKQIFREEVADRMMPDDWRRVHFLGRIPHEDFTRILQLSRVHVYLTYPFVLSWSLMEAMSCGAAIVASDTAPVREVITDGETGLLVDFFDRQTLVRRVSELLDDEEARARLGAAARKSMIEKYDLETICLPRQMAWVNEIMETPLVT